MDTVINVIDAGPLMNFVRAGELDLFVAGGRRAVITQQVLDEVLSDPLHPNSVAITAWVNAQEKAGNLTKITDPLTEADLVRYNPIGKNNQLGDVSIKKYMDLNSRDGQLFNVITNDGDLINFDGRNSRVPGQQGINWVEGEPYSGRYYSSESAVGYVNDLMMAAFQGRQLRFCMKARLRVFKTVFWQKMVVG